MNLRVLELDGINGSHWIHRPYLHLLPLALAMLLSAFPDCSWGQLRLYGRVDPNAGEPEKELEFDVNLSPDDNISPNIILTRDAKRGYVAYAGTGVVLGFSMETGEVTDQIETGGHPSDAILLPDGHTLAVVSAFDNKVFLIDIEARQLLATHAFERAEFGFGSTVASPDGAVGYLSSTGTGEVIKFQLSDGKELGRLRGLVAPCQITLSLDGATLMVVDTLAEELVFADAAALSRKTTLRAPSGFFFNFTLFNKAVLAPDGKTGIIASRDINGILGSDTVILFSAETGDLLDTRSIGNEPGFTGLTPDGKYWVIFNELTLSVISTTDFKSGKDLNLAQGESIGSANIVFSPDSRYAYYASSSYDQIFKHDLETGAVVAQIVVGDDPDNENAQASSMAITPDGGALAVVEFKSNKLDLLAGATVLDSTKFISSPDRFTGVSLINLAAIDNAFTLTALDLYGQTISGDGVTNPARINLPPNNQVSLTLGQIFNFDPTTEKVGWLRVSTEHPEAAGYLSIGDTSLNRLDAVPLLRAPAKEWIVPEIVNLEGETTELSLVNPYYTQTTYDWTLFERSGNQAEQSTGNIAYPTNRHAKSLVDIFPNVSTISDGYVVGVTPVSLLFTEWVESGSEISALNGIDVAKFSGITHLYSPQFAVTPGFKTILNVINYSQGDADITITLHNFDGSVIGKPLRKTLAKNEQLKDDLAVIFQDDPAVAGITGWLEVETTQDRILCTVTFTDEGKAFRTTFELSGTPSQRLLFPIVAQDDVYRTGIALLNANLEPAAVTVEVWGPGGTLDWSTSVVLEPGNRTAVYLNGFFPDMGPMLVGNIRVRSDQPLYGMALIHDDGFRFMTAIPPMSQP